MHDRDIAKEICHFLNRKLIAHLSFNRRNFYLLCNRDFGDGLSSCEKVFNIFVEFFQERTKYVNINLEICLFLNQILSAIKIVKI